LRSYERVFGKDFISTGGRGSTEALLKEWNFPKDAKVLDIGCGTGGSAFLMAHEHNATVLGLDLSANMLGQAIDRLAESDNDSIRDQVKFELLDATTADLPEGEYDVIYSRDAILHIGDKAGLFARCMKWLKPGGRIMISDYAVGGGADEEFEAYLADRQYQLTTVSNYGAILTAAGFADVVARDATADFVHWLKVELERMNTHKEQLLSEVGQEAFDKLEGGWKAKLVRVEKGYQAWGVYAGTKPAQ